jgi:hypothetical protein
MHTYSFKNTPIGIFIAARTHSNIHETRPTVASHDCTFLVHVNTTAHCKARKITTERLSDMRLQNNFEEYSEKM